MTKKIDFRASEYLVEMIEELRRIYKCTTTELMRILITSRFHEIKLNKENKDD